MTKSNESPTGGDTCVYNLHVHLVFVTKYQHGGIPKEILKDLCQFIDSVYKDFGSEWLEVNGEDNHTGSFW
ncbi:transposase [Methylacidiphilum fumariolicum]|uniref:Transposase IS200-like domain-containing protein n=1 Tax=Candidatus Methylacidiphilum fumarolicum TaxID=591154 RepID=A0ABM9IBR2_9BACT|nr:transposase [Candidatus Methylacidiphilum fumarolicum]CAI9085088.1 protein of unknown function [Candidatus Methylacidiphilum fumarolicum]